MKAFLSLVVTSTYILLIGMAAGAAERASYQIESWTTDNGLPQNTVYSILQTPDGYLWMTTLDGVVRFDGVRFTVFNKTNTAGIESNRFTKLILDGQGDMWMATESDRITRYRNGTFKTYRFGNEESPDEIFRLLLDPNRQLVVTTIRNGFRWDGESFILSPPVAGEKPGDTILWGRDGSMWYTSGVKVYHAAGGAIDVYQLPIVKTNTRVTKMLEDSRGRLWVGTQNAGLSIIEDKKIRAYSPADDYAGEISPNLEDRDGNIWAGPFIIAPDGTVTRLAAGQWLSDEAVTDAFQDREGTIWLGTTHQGINRLNKQTIKFYTTADGLGASGVYPIFEDRAGDIWLGGGDLTKYHAGNFNRVAGHEVFGRQVTAITQDHTGRMWFGIWTGAYYFENDVYTDFSPAFGRKVTVYDIYEDKNNNLWFSTNDGLFRYRADVLTRFTAADGLASNDVKIAREARDGTLWIGTYGGLSYLRDDVFTTFTNNDGLASNLVRSLYEDTDGVLWIGSYDGGLTRLKDGRFTVYSTNNGLFNDGVFQILEDGRGNLWMSSNRGIYRTAKQQLTDLADGRITHFGSNAFNKADGLAETECNGGQQPAGIKTRDGQFWFPTQNGVAVLDPDAINVNPISPPVIIEGAKIENETMAIGRSIEIAPGKSNLEISYTALSFIKPEFVIFRYKLEGQDPDWVEAGNRRTAYYSYLPPGDYTFQVIAANSDGVWNNTGAHLTISVKPPFYRTWWFLVLALAAITTTVYLLFRWRIARLEKARLEQEEFSRKLLSSQEYERQRIAAELHDSIGQSLLIIKNRAFLALSDLGDPALVREQLEELSQSADGAIGECREISYNLRPYQIHRFGLTITLESIFHRISEVTDIETTIAIEPIDGIFSAEAETNIYRIVQESVNNIIKHSAASEAGFFVKVQEGGIDILIQDDGQGFDQDQVAPGDGQRGGFGLIGMSERVRMLGGNYEINSAPEQGTTIKIRLAIPEK